MDTTLQTRYTFRRTERLKLKNRIDLLFSKGRSKTSGCLRMVYLLTEEKLEAHVQVMFSVPKSSFKKAVDRNLLKRRMREAYRLNKHILNEQFGGHNPFLLMALLYSGKTQEPYKYVEDNLIKLLKGLKNQK